MLREGVEILKEAASHRRHISQGEALRFATGRGARVGVEVAGDGLHQADDCGHAFTTNGLGLPDRVSLQPCDTRYDEAYDSPLDEGSGGGQSFDVLSGLSSSSLRPSSPDPERAQRSIFCCIRSASSGREIGSV